jgi:hypothetical protein
MQPHSRPHSLPYDTPSLFTPCRLGTGKAKHNHAPPSLGRRSEIKSRYTNSLYF